MKILIIQENGHHDSNRHFRECFCMSRSLEKMGHTTEVWGKGHDNFNELPQWESYDLILNFENYDSTGWVPTLADVRTPKKILWSIDAHCRGMTPFTDTFYTGKYDLILQSTKDFVDDNSVWFPNCYDASLFKPCSDKRTLLGFCGSLLNRKPMLDFLTQKYNLKQDIWVLGEDMVKEVSSYGVHFNMNLANDINYRSFETLGCGTLLLTNYNPQYEELGFIDGENCLMYKDINSLCQKIEYCIKNPESVDEMTKNGIELARNHTYDVRAKKLISLCTGKEL